MKFLPRLALLGQTIIAAGTFLIAKDATTHFGPLELVWFRIMGSAVLMVTFFTLRTGTLMPRVKGGDHLRLVLLGLFGIAVNQGFFMWGLASTTPLHASLLYAFTPILVMMGAILWLGEKLTARRTIGVALSIVGVALVLTSRGLNLSEGPFRGDLLVLVAVGAWATYTVLGKDMLRRYGTLTVVAGSFVFGAMWMAPFSYTVLHNFDWNGPGLRGWLDLSYLCVATSGIAFTLWYWGLKRLEASEASRSPHSLPPHAATEVARPSVATMPKNRRGQWQGRGHSLMAWSRPPLRFRRS